MRTNQVRYRFYNATYIDMNGDDEEIPDGIWDVCELDFASIEIGDNCFIDMPKPVFEKLKREGKATPEK